MVRWRLLLGWLALLAAGCSREPSRPPAAALSAPAVAPSASSAPPLADGPPIAPVRPVADTYFGMTVIDPYRWMEDGQSTELASWMRGQSDFTRRQLDAIPQRAGLLARIQQLGNSGDAVAMPEVAAGHWFYLRSRKGLDRPQYCVRDSLDGPERVVVDLNSMQRDDVSIDWTSPSLDGKLLAYGLSEGGSEATVLHIVDTATGKLLPDTWDRMRIRRPHWVDALHFFYTRLQKVPDGAPATEKNKRATSYLHELGRDPDKDPPIVGAGVTPSIPVKDTEIGFAFRAEGTRWVFALPAAGTRRESAVYFAPLTKLAGTKTPWRKLFDPSDEVTSFDVHGDDVYFLTHKGAPRFKVMKTSLARPDVATAAVVVHESDVVLQWIGVARDALYVGDLDAGIARMRRIGYSSGASAEAVPLPVDGAYQGTSTGPDRDGVIFGLRGWTSPFLVYAYDPKIKRVTDTKLTPPPPVDLSSVTSEEVRVRSVDGTIVPMSIIRTMDFAKDGSHPAWLEVYASYGISIEPHFPFAGLSWLERGGIYAFCHARGGGELGAGWHEDGKLLKKQHSIDDMIACGQWLVDNRYTQSSKLGGKGESAGAIVVGGAINQRPDLFAAALILVGISNPLRLEQSNAGNVPELGTVATPDGFAGLYAMDAYSHVKEGAKYPAVLLTTGVNDARVAPWQAAKMVARLQAATSSGKPVLLRINYDGGHGMGSTLPQVEDAFADAEAFLLSQFGER